MFESVDDADVVEAIASAAREENAATGRRLLWMGELYARRAPEDDVEKINWAIDGHANVVAEISAALNISRGRAAGQLRYAIDLRERLPKVAEVFATGAIDFRMMAALVSRSQNVTDPELLANLDTAFAQWSPKWMKMSGPKLTERIDMWVEKFDQAGVREPRPTRENRYVEIGPSSTPGMANIWGHVSLTEGAALDQRLDEVAASVCRSDPRTKDQRGADALIALSHQQTRLQCGCGASDCPADGGEEKSLGEVVLHVLAEQAALSGQSQNPGYLPGFGPVPAPLLRELAQSGDAKLKPLKLPPPECEPRYRPSTALAEFVRWRDLTCRWPGCDEPAANCQIDHTMPYPLGPTHPSNIKMYCPHHHLLKTFYIGEGGWSERQLPDGTLILTAPTGHVYTTTPGGAQFFSQLATPTGELALPEQPGTTNPNRGMMMPKRQRTRAQERAYRIALERQHNAARIARKQLLLSERIARDDEPPPF